MLILNLLTRIASLVISIEQIKNFFFQEND
jgi:hypothetical protein